MNKLENILDKKLFTIVEDVFLRIFIPLESLIESKCVHKFGFNQVNDSIGGNQ